MSLDWLNLELSHNLNTELQVQPKNLIALNQESVQQGKRSQLRFKFESRSIVRDKDRQQRSTSGIFDC